MSLLIDGIGAAITVLAKNIQGRIERLKNESEALLEERKKIMDGESNDSTRRRVFNIDERLRQIHQILENNAHD